MLGERGVNAQMRQRRPWKWAALFVSVLITGTVHAHMDTRKVAAGGTLHVPDPERARVWSLGFAPVLADLYWVRLLALVGAETGDIERHADVIAEVVELVTTLDPWVDHPYRFAAIWLTRNSDDVRRANRLLARAIAYHPLDWRNRFYLGYNEFFYLEENRRAADVLAPAVGMPGAPAYLGALVGRLRADGGSLDTAAFYLRALIRGATDEYARAEYLKSYDEILTERHARELDAARVTFWKRYGRDIRTPAELWSGPDRVLERMPPAHPHFKSFTWQLDPKTNDIVSSFYGTRYRLHLEAPDAERRRDWSSKPDAGGDRQRGDGEADPRPGEDRV
jgi:hypothetical protein